MFAKVVSWVAKSGLNVQAVVILAMVGGRAKYFQSPKGIENLVIASKLPLVKLDGNVRTGTGEESAYVLVGKTGSCPIRTVKSEGCMVEAKKAFKELFDRGILKEAVVAHARKEPDTLGIGIEKI